MNPPTRGTTRATTRFAAGTAALAAAVLTTLGPASAAHAGDHGSDSPNAQDKTYVSDSAEGDLFEIAAGRLAIQRSHDPAVRRFGQRMVTDHTRLYRATRQIGGALGIDVPTSPSEGQRAVLRSWRHVSGHSFRCAYVPYEWEDHQLDISEARDEVDDGQAPAVVSDAQQALPVLKTHLDLVRKLLHTHHC